jgi:hypothetical protein
MISKAASTTALGHRQVTALGTPEVPALAARFAPEQGVVQVPEHDAE